MFSAREKYMKVENDSKIKKALNSRIPAPKLELYENGEEVWYRHGMEGIWQGPGVVIGQQNKVIFLRQGRFILAASQTNVRKRNQGNKDRIMKELKRMVKERKKERKERKEKKEDMNEQESDQDSDQDSDDEARAMKRKAQRIWSLKYNQRLSKSDATRHSLDQSGTLVDHLHI